MKKYFLVLTIILYIHNLNAQSKKLQFEDDNPTNFMKYDNSGLLTIGEYGDNGNIGKIFLSGTRNNLAYGQGGELEFDGGYGTRANILMKYTGAHEQTWLGITSSNNNYPLRVGIGTNSPDMKLTVNGKIHAKEVKIDLNIPAPDYVFKSDYNLISIEELEKFIKEKHHLPEIPTAEEFEENGVMQAEMDMNLLKKIEELTLYTIQQEKKIEKLEKKNAQLDLMNKKLLELQNRLKKLEKK